MTNAQLFANKWLARDPHPGMPPASRPSMAGDFLVPLLRMDSGSPDPIAIETWHLVLGSAIAVEIPHDLFALWLFPVGGGAVLLGPEALSADQVEVPVPEPLLQQDHLYRLEETLRRAKYASALAAPVRHGARDVGLMLLGSFARAALGPTQAIALRRLGDQLGPTMADLAAKLPAVSPRSLVESSLTRDNLPEHLARAAAEALTGADLVGRTSALLYPLLPHDRLEILVPGAAPGSYLALSGNTPRRRWSGAGGADPLSTVIAQFGQAPAFLVPKLDELEPQVDWSTASHPLPARSLLGARLRVGDSEAGYVLLGSVAREAFRTEDEELVALAALMLAPRVAALHGPPEASRPAEPPSGGDAPPIRRAASSLAEKVSLEEGLRGFAAELGRVLPHQRMVIQLRLGESEVIVLDPDALHPLGDLPSYPIRGMESAALLRDEREWLSVAFPEGEEVHVPLRVAGRTVGILGVRTAGFPAAQQAAALLRPFADVLAPHLELLRRGIVPTGPARLATVPRPRP